MYSLLKIKGQCTFVFKDESSSINIRFTDIEQNTVITVILDDHVKVCCDIDEYTDVNNHSGTVQIHGSYYWISINAETQEIFVGIGEPRMETVIYRCVIPTHKVLLESIASVHYEQNTTILRILRDPIAKVVPLVVKNTDDLTMEDIALNRYMPKSQLSIVTQKLYDCISGKKFILDEDNFPDFSKAIEYSIATPGLWCHEKLISKSREFNPNVPNIKETYLRITLGENAGESPGIPYVMEIWPPGHYSPIHSHAEANAIIRVLHGTIHVKLYPFLSSHHDSVDPFGEADFTKDEITWISSYLNETHQLVNKRDETCVTIQCYMYEKKNIRHYEYFDYLDGDGNKQQYLPDSDMDFISFKKQMQMEWNNRENI